MARWRMAVDCSVAAALAGAAALVAYHGGGTAPGTRPVDAVGFMLIAVATLPLSLRRRFPVPVTAVVGAAVFAYLMLGYGYGPVQIAFGIAVYTVARYAPQLVALIIACGALVVQAVPVLVRTTELESTGGLAVAAAWVVAPYSLGFARRMWRQAQENEKRREQQHALDAERLRLAHDIHDVVGHGLAAIRMQSDVALHIRDRNPNHAFAALETISRTSAEALGELRLALAGIAPDSEVGLEHVHELCSRMQETGLDVELTVEGEPAPLSSAADVAAYRVVQESLTNALKHSTTRTANITVTHLRDRVDLTVASPLADEDDTDGSGYGLAGMRRRVDEIGGSFHAGPETAPTRAPFPERRHFTVRVSLPRA